jgi:hypothetical protein
LRNRAYAVAVGRRFAGDAQHVKSGDPVVLQIERDGKLQYLAFEME